MSMFTVCACVCVCMEGRQIHGSSWDYRKSAINEKKKGLWEFLHLEEKEYWERDLRQVGGGIKEFILKAECYIEFIHSIQFNKHLLNC